MKYRFLNLACGDFYVGNSEWLNLDWYPHSEHVHKANLLTKIDLPNDSLEAIYSSHFIEHIPKDKLDFILSECFRILKPGGIMRIVVPDFENIVREYIRNLDNKEYEKAEFNTIELLDQCVRNKSGGTLAEWRGNKNLTAEFRDYISYRTGYLYKKSIALSENPRKFTLRIPKITLTRVQWIYCKTLTLFMPKWFAHNHINFTNTGELHKWVYDERVLSKHLSAVGFKKITRVSSSESQIPNFPSTPLDLDEKGNIRKGAESMYLEALK
jgi:SAM-dependent methyltransferase